MEYALESVALFNPSIVPALIRTAFPRAGPVPDEPGATGEGHVSSIVFRVGIIDARGNIELEPPGPHSRPLKATVPDEFDKPLFQRDLARWASRRNIHADPRPARTPFHARSARGGHRTAAGRRAGLGLPGRDRRHPDLADPGELSTSPAPSAAEFASRDRDLPVLGHRTPRHRRPAARAVHRRRRQPYYYGTFTAYNGDRVFPQLLEYPGGDTIDIRLITGECAKNKGMALFPRRIHGRFAMISRIDNENLYYMESDDIGIWDEARLIQGRSSPGRSCRSATAARRSRPRRAGCS